MKPDVEIVGFDLGHGETAVALAMFAATTEPQILDIHGSKSIITAVAQHPTRGTLIGDDAFMARNVSSLRIAFKSPEIDRFEMREPVKLFVGKVLSQGVDDILKTPSAFMLVRNANLNKPHRKGTARQAWQSQT